MIFSGFYSEFPGFYGVLNRLVDYGFGVFGFLGQGSWGWPAENTRAHRGFHGGLAGQGGGL